jgi:hypothetical protein
MAETAPEVNRILRLPWWHWTHDQGEEGSCVGHGIAMERAITNTSQNIFLNIIGWKTRRYDPIHIWNEAKKIDYWPDTNPGDDNGTSVRAGYDVARDQGLSRVRTMEFVEGVGIPRPVEPGPVDVSEGILTNRWATTVDEMRTAIANGLPVTIGVTWWSNFDSPVEEFDVLGKRGYWIGKGPLGRVRGGHCLTVYGASDRRQAFRLKNSWGKSYPLVWLPYTTMQTLLDDYGEAALVTDR